MTLKTVNLPVLSAEGNLAIYLQEIKKFPMLSKEEEYMLARRYKEHGDSNAAHKLVTSLCAASESPCSLYLFANIYSSSGVRIGNFFISCRYIDKFPSDDKIGKFMFTL